MRLTACCHRLLLAAHHVVIDGWSFAVLHRELAEHYNAILAGTALSLPEPLQMEDFIRQQETSRRRGEWAEHATFWRRRLASPSPALELPADRPRPALKSYRGARHVARMDRELTARLTHLGHASGCSLVMTLMAAWTALLHRLTGQDELTTGTSTANRPNAEHDCLLGYLTHILPVRSTHLGKSSFNAHLERIRDEMLESYEHAAYPFAEILEQLHARRDTGRLPVLDTLINLDRAFEPEPMEGLQTSWLSAPIRYAIFDLSINVTPIGGSLVFEWDYNNDLFDAESVARIAGHFRTLIECVLRAARRSRWPRCLFSPILSGVRCLQTGTTRPWTIPASAASMSCSKEQARCTPEQPALLLDRGDLTPGQREGDVAVLRRAQPAVRRRRQHARRRRRRHGPSGRPPHPSVGCDGHRNPSPPSRPEGRMSRSIPGTRRRGSRTSCQTPARAWC